MIFIMAKEFLGGYPLETMGQDLLLAIGKRAWGAGGRGEAKGRVLPRRAGTLLSPSFSSLTVLTQTWPSTTAEVTPALVWKENFGGW